MKAKSTNKREKGFIQLLMMAGAIIAIAAVGCTKKKNDITQVSTDAYLSKSDLTGCPGGTLDTSCAKTYSAVKTFVSADENLDATGVVPGFHADLGFVQFYITEKELQVRRVGEPNHTADTATVVASFPITSHFDIVRETNDFGEQTNKIVEDSKKPWSDRQYIRVDIGTNKIKSTSLSSIFSTTISEEGSQVVSTLKRDGALLSFDVDSTITQTDYLDSSDQMTQVSAALRAHVKNTFLEVKPSDYVPYEMSNKEFSRFGYFRTYENFVNPDKGVTVSGRRLLANRFNICENSAMTAGKSCSTNKIIYTLNKGFPDEYRQPARDVIEAWNRSFQKALDRTDDVVILDESVQPEIGDTRYNMIAGVDENVPTGLLGVSQTVNNPNTGETLSARASVYLGTVRLEGGMAAEEMDMLLKSQSEESLKSTDAQKILNTKSGAKLLVSHLKLRDKIFSRSRGRTSLGSTLMPRPKGQVIAALKSMVLEPEGSAIFRRKNAMDKVTGYFDISDVSWKQDKRDDSQKFNMLKDNILMGRNAKLQKLKQLSASEKGIESSELVEPAVEQFIQKFITAHKSEPLDKVREQLKVEVRKMVFFTTLVHEMGHNFGLRHNFASSSDNKNYTAKYYDLEKQKQGLAGDDPKREALALEQESYDFSSVMDYTGGFTETMGGTGPYDDAAIRYAYNSGINKDGDALTGIVHGYKFCTDHEIGEDLLCRQWDKGPNVSVATTNMIDDYRIQRYAFRNFRRDRANFGSGGGYFSTILMRVMLPIRQVSDELLYRIITSSSVPASDSQCDLAYLREAVESGEIGNICDPQVVQKYASQGIDISDWSKLVYFLLTDDLTGFRKDPRSYKASGLADLLLANNQASQFFIDVLGTPEPGQYYPMGDGAGGYNLELLPAVSGTEDDRLIQFLASKGVTGDQAQAQLPKIRGNIVDLNPGPQAKFLLSRVSQDGSFRQVDIMAHLYDKLAAIIIMGARGLPVEKYQEVSLNTNMFFSPQTKAVATTLISSLINEDTFIAARDVTTRSGAAVSAAVPASMNLDTKYYGLTTALSDFISDQNQEFADKMRICTATEKGCQDGLGLGQVSFRGANGQDEYRAVQVPTGDSVVYSLVSKGEEISKVRDQSLTDIKNKEALSSQVKKALGPEGIQVSSHQKDFLALLKAKSPELAKNLDSVYGAGEQSLWSVVVGEAKALDQGEASTALAIKSAVSDGLSQSQKLIQTTLAKNAALLKEVQKAAAPVDNDLSVLSDVSARVIAAPALVQNATSQLAPIEADAKVIRMLRGVMGVD